MNEQGKTEYDGYKIQGGIVIMSDRLGVRRQGDCLFGRKIC
jgi:hypothetical protein